MIFNFFDRRSKKQKEKEKLNFSNNKENYIEKLDRKRARLTKNNYQMKNAKNNEIEKKNHEIEKKNNDDNFEKHNSNFVKIFLDLHNMNND